MIEVSLQKLLGGWGGGGLHDCLGLPLPLTTNTWQLEILVTTLLLAWNLTGKLHYIIKVGFPRCKRVSKLDFRGKK